VEDRFVPYARLEPRLERLDRLVAEHKVDALIAELRNPMRAEVLTVRGQAARRLAALKAKRAAVPIAALLAEPDAYLRDIAARSLGQIAARDETVVRALAYVARTDDDDEVRASAIASLGEIGDSSVLPTVIRLLEHEAFKVRIAAIYAVSVLGDDNDRRLAKERFRREGWRRWLYLRSLPRAVAERRKELAEEDIASRR
jgi:HEAT repeat protein